MNPILKYKFINHISELSFVESIYLYGSRARGDFRPRSDIDLAIVCPSASSAEWQQTLQFIETADTLLQIDCLRYDHLLNMKLKDNIDQEKVVLYER